MTLAPRPDTTSGNYGCTTAGLTCTYDAWDRLVKVADDSGPPVTIETYEYDGLHRRIEKDDQTNVYDYYYDGHQVVEEHIDEDTTNYPLAQYDREPGYEKHPRSEPGSVHMDDRFAGGGLEVELPFAPGEAKCEAGRCFDCGVITIFDGERCILCGGCVDVCPQNCLRIVSLEQMYGGHEIEAATSAQLGDFRSQAASAILRMRSRAR